MLFELYDDTLIPAMFIASELSISCVPQKVLQPFIRKVNDLITSKDKPDVFISASERNLQWAIYTISCPFSQEFNPEITINSLESCLYIIRLFTESKSHIPAIYLKSSTIYLKIMLLQVLNLFKSNFMMKNAAYHNSTALIDTTIKIFQAVTEYIMHCFQRKENTNNSRLALFFINFFMRMCKICFNHTNNDALIHSSLSRIAVDALFYSLLLKHFVDDTCPLEYWKTTTDNFKSWLFNHNSVRSWSNIFLVFANLMDFGLVTSSNKVDPRLLSAIINNKKLIKDTWFLLYNIGLTSIDYIFDFSSKVASSLSGTDTMDSPVNKLYVTSRIRQMNYVHCLKILTNSISDCILAYSRINDANSKICEFHKISSHPDIVSPEYCSHLFLSQERPSLNSIFTLFSKFIFGVSFFFIRKENSDEVVNCFSDSICEVCNVLNIILDSKRIDEKLNFEIEDNYISTIEFHLQSTNTYTRILLTLLQNIGSILSTNFANDSKLYNVACKLQIMFSYSNKDTLLLRALIDNIFALKSMQISLKFDAHNKIQSDIANKFLKSVKDTLCYVVTMDIDRDTFKDIMSCFYSFLIESTYNESSISELTSSSDSISVISRFTLALELMDAFVNVFTSEKLAELYKFDKIDLLKSYGLLLMSLIDLKDKNFLEKAIILVEQLLEFVVSVISELIERYTSPNFTTRGANSDFLRLIISIILHWLGERFYFISKSPATKYIIEIIEALKRDDPKLMHYHRLLTNAAVVSQMCDKYRSDTRHHNHKLVDIIKKFYPYGAEFEDFNSFLIDYSNILFIKPLDKENKLLIYIIDEFSSYHWIVDFCIEEVNYSIIEDFDLETRQPHLIDPNKLLIKPHTNLLTHYGKKILNQSCPGLDSEYYKNDQYIKQYLDFKSSHSRTDDPTNNFMKFKLPEIFPDEHWIRVFLSTYICDEFIFTRPTIKSINSDGFKEQRNRCFDLIRKVEEVPNYDVLNSLVFFIDERKISTQNDEFGSENFNFSHPSVCKFKRFLLESDDNLHLMTHDKESVKSDYLLYTKFNTRIKFEFNIENVMPYLSYDALVIFLENSNNINIESLSSLIKNFTLGKNSTLVIYLAYILNPRRVKIYTLNEVFTEIHPMPIKSGMVVEYKCAPSLIARSIYNHNFIHSELANDENTSIQSRKELIEEIGRILKDDLTDKMSCIFNV